MDDLIPPSRTPAGDMLTVEPCVDINLEELTMNFDRRYALYIHKVYHRMHFTVSGCWNKSLKLQPLQRCYCENSGSHASACVMQRHYSVTYTQSLHAVSGFIAPGASEKLTLWTSLVHFETPQTRIIRECPLDS